MRALSAGVCLCAFLPFAATAQQSLYQSTSGDSAIFLNGEAGVLLFNLGASKGTLGYQHQVSGTGWGFGGDLTGAAQGGVVSLIKNSIPQTSLGGDIVFNKSSLFYKPPPPPGPGSGTDLPCTFCGDWLVLDFGYQRAQLYNISSLTPPVPSPQQHNFDGYTGTLAYNQLRKKKSGPMSGDYLLGLSAGISRANDTSSLTTTVQFGSQQPLASASGPPLVVSGTTKSAYVGAYEKYIGVPVNADAIWYPDALKGRFGLDLFERSNAGQAYRFISPGFGLFIAQDKNPSRPIGGITISYKDHRGQLTLVTGWTF
jgi:hypothetical protein